MPTLVHTNENKDATYFLTKDDGARICWCHEDYPEEMRADRLPTAYASKHKVNQAEADRMAIAIRGGNLTDPDAPVEDPRTPQLPAEGDVPKTTTKKKTTMTK